MATWQYRAWIVPASAAADAPAALPSALLESGTPFWGQYSLQAVASVIDTLELERSQSWDPLALLWGAQDGDYVSLRRQGERIDEIGVGLDARKSSAAFILGLASLLRQLDAVMVDIDGQILGADPREIARALLASSAGKFVADPVGYLEAAARHARRKKGRDDDERR